MGEVAERSEGGEGKLDCSTLSVTFGDSSPKGGAKGLYRYAPVPVLRPPMKGAAAAFRPEFARLSLSCSVVRAPAPRTAHLVRLSRTAHKNEKIKKAQSEYIHLSAFAFVG